MSSYNKFVYNLIKRVKTINNATLLVQRNIIVKNKELFDDSIFLKCDYQYKHTIK
jgi:hypothetical protein